MCGVDDLMERSEVCEGQSFGNLRVGWRDGEEREKSDE
jgi:hypothetical protein